MDDLKHPDVSEDTLPGPDLAAGGLTEKPAKELYRGPRDAHPSGKESHGRPMQIVRGLLLVAYATVCCSAFVGPPRLALEKVDQIPVSSSLSTSALPSTLLIVNGITPSWP